MVNWLRKEHYAGTSSNVTVGGARVGFLMPCHSTPFGSYMWDVALKDGKPSAWFLTCEPPVGVPVEKRDEYVDEADEFYNNPTDFLYRRFGKPPLLGDTDSERGEWPDKLVSFEATAQLVTGFLRIGSEEARYMECKRFFNSHFHDDGRRKGDVIVWCLR